MENLIRLKTRQQDFEFIITWRKRKWTWRNYLINRDKIKFTIAKLDRNLNKFFSGVSLYALSVSTTEPSASDIKVRLPKLEIKKFAGNILEW